MRVLAVIPARAGSKRLPGKNMRCLRGVPLVGWTISLAQSLKPMVETVVSTDDPEVAVYATSVGIQVPWLRPANLSNDHSTSVDVALHALSWFESTHEEVDAILLLQPTSPFRTRESVQSAIQLVESGRADAVLGVCPVRTHPRMALRVERGQLFPGIVDAAMPQRSQDLDLLYEPCGSIYVVRRDLFVARKAFYEPGDHAILIDSEVEAIDIDTPWDWQIAEWVVRAGHSLPNCPQYGSP